MKEQEIQRHEAPVQNDTSFGGKISVPSDDNAALYLPPCLHLQSEPYLVFSTNKSHRLRTFSVIAL